ncbi:Chitin synthase, class 2, partial [Blyttiomyces sp. JEL0837]
PDHFVSRGYNLRAANYQRQTEIFVVVTMYNEDAELFNRTIFALAQNIRYLCKLRAWGWDENAWKKVVVCIVSDGRSKVHPDVLKVLEVMGVYQDGLAQASINNEAVEGHIYEYTAQSFMDEHFNIWTAAEGMVPMQVLFCLKEKNAKKINSHRWFFNAFAPLLNPTVCVLVDVGTKPSNNSLYYLWEAFFRNEQIAGACGEIRADLGKGMTYFKNLLNPLVASQNFEYKISNLLDKSLESVFGYISVLPGAFSAYRYQALLDNGPNTGPLSKYFEGEVRKDKPTDSSIFSANLYLAEDRILCFELVAKRHARWTLHYVSRVYGETDVPDAVPEFLSQRRRWLNGSLFAGFYAMANISQIWRTDHRIVRKITFTLQYLYNVLNQLFSWFILGNFATTFYFLFNDLKGILDDPYGPTVTHPTASSKIIKGIITAAQFSYPVVLICMFIIAFGNRPQSFKLTYTMIMFMLAAIGAVMTGLLISRMISLFTVNTSGLSNDYYTFLNQSAAMAGAPTNDSMQFIVNTVIWNVADVMNKQLQDNLKKGVLLQVTYLMSIASTFGVMFAASFLQLDFAHMFTCFIQYLLMLPSYINVLTIYALSNIHDVSWGTKGDTKAEVLPTVAAVKQKDGTVVADVDVAADKADLSAHYHIVKEELLWSASQPKPVSVPDAKQQQEDEYRGFRTKLLLLYLSTNAILFFVAASLTNTDTYLLVLLGGVTLLQGVKLIGVLFFLAAKLFTDVFHCCNAGRKRYRRGEYAVPSQGAGMQSGGWDQQDKNRLALPMVDSGRGSRMSVASTSSTILTSG